MVVRKFSIAIAVAGVMTSTVALAQNPAATTPATGSAMQVSAARPSYAAGTQPILDSR